LGMISCGVDRKRWTVGNTQPISVLFYFTFFFRGLRDAGITGAAGASAPLAFCIFNFVGAVRVQTMGTCNRYTKLLQQTELNVVRGCVWGCSTPQSSGIRQSCYRLAKGETESIAYGIFGAKLRRNCA
jgi:hypothetical protein